MALRRPRTRGDCVDGPRPCPWIACRHHLLARQVLADGDLKTAFGRLTWWDVDHALDCLETMLETCCLDVAADGPHTLDEIGAYTGVTREAVRLTQNAALGKMRRAFMKRGILLREEDE